MKKSLLFVFGFSLGVSLLIGCSSNEEPKTNNEKPITASKRKTTNEKQILLPDTCELEKHLIASGLVDIQKIIPDILIDLRYSTTNNFMHTDVYGDLERIYLQPDVAEKLKLAQQYLKEKDSSLSLLVFDGVRPRSVQQIMWDTVDIPLSRRGKFVSNPAKGSLHNFGAAVDLTIATVKGEELDMGTAYDDSTALAYPEREYLYLKTGELSEEQINNRKLLRAVMTKAGFFNIQTEWWHFNSCYREEAMRKYEIVE